MFIDAQSRRLPVGDKPRAIKARVSHAHDDLIGRAGQHVPPIARKLDWSGEKRGSLLDRRG